MNHLATLVLAGTETEEVRALHDCFTSNSYAGRLAASGAAALEEVRRARPDVLVIAPRLADGMSALDVLGLVKADAALADMAVVVLTDRPLAESGDALLAAGAADAIACPCPPGVVLARVRPLVRVATMQEEFHQRAAVMGTTSLLDASEEARAAQILVIGQASDAAMVEAALGEAGRITQTADLFEAQGLLEARPYDAAVMVGRGGSEAPLELCLQIRRNPRLFNLPVLFLSDGDAAKAYAMGASAVMPLDVPAAELRFAALAQVRRQRRRWALRRALDTTLTAATVDPAAPTAYGADYLGRYLPRRVAATLKAHRQLSVIAFDFAGVDAIRQEFGSEAEAHLLGQIGQWLTLLVRAEDLVARQAGARFIVVLPDTPLSEAEVVMHRIAGVISSTDFAVADVYRVVNVWAAVGAAALTDGDDDHSLLERATASPGMADIGA
ncbi:diguanylate cyclase [Novispirillum sp. DQ9]|uniref:diguanylate cyclase n=1 Tax=Novispirillum sp. DQ9 TaxID=3398612 RepID=UPI003C7E871D